ncbi:MAG: pyridoxine 5'-phosphate synthase [Candidatus Omnitrophica bacterium]|nr:pyridoxine 5'-phosphate synthase [Candidatus Omnitrophota bacterium]MDD5436056.1 pyridoxine 5'-phosphate synthase [Candidatus Omnitrophota bacterium]
MPKLGINIDHVATLREARKTYMPDPVEAALICEKAGCDSIVCHLREDRRHIKDADVVSLRKAVKTRLNLEMSVAPGIVDFACKIRPDQATLVPEKREEVTTEGGLDVRGNLKKLSLVTARLKARGIGVSFFINPAISQIEASLECGAGIIELHTGEYANAGTAAARKRELDILEKAAKHALSLGLEVNAGHGLHYENVCDVARIKGMNELNIGHSIISRAVFVGISAAVREMLELI